MKKILMFFCLSIFLMACSSDDDSGSRVTELTPPSWILGDWRYVVSDGTGQNLTVNGYNFLPTDVCEVNAATVHCFKSQFSGQTDFYFEESKKNNSEYKFLYRVGDKTFEYSFTRIDDNKIRQVLGVDYPNAILERIN